MNWEIFRSLIEGALFASTVLGLIGTLFVDRLILNRLSGIFVNRTEFDAYKQLVDQRDQLRNELSQRTSSQQSDALDKLANSIEKLSEEQRRLGEILASIEGKLSQQ